MVAKKKSSKSTKFVFSWTKLLVGMSLAFNLAVIVFLITLIKTSAFDSTLMNTILGRNYDNQGCYLNRPTSQNLEYDRLCITSFSVDGDNKVLAPEWLKGQTFPSSN